MKKMRIRSARNKARDRIAKRPAFQRKFIRSLSNLMMSRSTLVGTGQRNGLDKGTRDLDRECHYIEGDPTLDEYRMMYDQEGVAARICNVLSEETWSVYPSVYETEDAKLTAFERAWSTFEKEQNPYYYLSRADELSRIGYFGVLLIGLDDGRDLSKPVRGIDKEGLPKKGYTPKGEDRPKVIYLRPFSNDLVRIEEVEDDPANRRFQQPKYYTIRMTDGTLESQAGGTQTNYAEVRVHWTRILHLAPNCKSSEIYSQPQLRNLHRRVFDVRKILGASAEMFYKGGFPGISFETDPDLIEGADIDIDSLKEEIEAYSNDLQRYIRLVGMTAKSLAPQVADPSKHLLEQYINICLTLRVPLRIFLGSEAGHLASTQDAQTWNKRVAHNQKIYAGPRIIKPFADRLILMGVLPAYQNLTIEWKDLNSISDKDKADVAVKRAQAVLQYVTSGSAKYLPPQKFFTLVLQFTEDEAASIIKAAGGEKKIMKEADKLMSAQLAKNTKGGTGTNPSKRTGASGKRNAQSGKSGAKRLAA